MSYSSSELLAALPRLRRYARLLTDDPAGADDLVARTLARARRVAGADAARSHRSELLALLRAVHAEELEQLRASDAMPAPPPAAAEPRAGPEAAQSHDADPQRVLDELHRLPLEQREVVILVAVERMSYEEVAALLRVPVATVLARLLQAREALRSSAIGRARAQLGGQR